MHTFLDNRKREWRLEINIDAVKRLKGTLDVDLLQTVDGQLLERLIGDPVLLCDIVYVLCKPQADADKVSDENFGRAMAGDAIDDATKALLEELVDFFPGARRRLLRKVLDKLERLEAMTLAATERVLDSGELEKLMQAELDKQDLQGFVEESLRPSTSGGGSTDSPEQSASIPDR